MPQVDKLTLMPQVFWLVLIFLGVYFYLSNYRLKPFNFYLKFKNSFFFMNIYFFLFHYYKNKIKFNLHGIFDNYQLNQVKSFKFVNRFNLLINKHHKLDYLTKYSLFLQKYSGYFANFFKQDEIQSKNII